MTRLNTQWEAMGAEYLVLGHLLIQGIHAYKAPLNNPGYDLIAIHPDKAISCRIQVKSRYATDHEGGFPIQNEASDIVVFVALNRGYRYGSKKRLDKGQGIQPPDYYVFPMSVIQAAKKDTSRWSKVYLRDIQDVKSYKDHWALIMTCLEG